MSLAFEITVADVFTVLRRNKLVCKDLSAATLRELLPNNAHIPPNAADIRGTTLLFLAKYVCYDLDEVAIEQAALNAGDDLDDQTDAAFSEIANQLQTMGLIEIRDIPPNTPLTALQALQKLQDPSEGVDLDNGVIRFSSDCTISLADVLKQASAPATFYKAWVITDHRKWDFEAFGASEEEARTSLIKGLRRHTEQVDEHLDPEAWLAENSSYIEVQAVEMGTVYRDRQVLLADAPSQPDAPRPGSRHRQKDDNDSGISPVY